MDFFKINYTDLNFQLPTDKIDFISDFNNATGQIDDKVTGKYFDFKFTKYQSQRILIAGSIHKYFNRTDFNGNDFTFENLNTTIYDLRSELNLKPDFCKLENLEVGVNLQVDFDPNLFLKHLLFHRSEEFNKPIRGAFYYQSAKNEYIIKIYNKTAQYQRKLNEITGKLKLSILKSDERKDLEFLKSTIETKLKTNTLRFEIKFTKMGVLNDLGVSNLLDLQNPSNYLKVKNLLLKEFNEVVFYDYTINENSMSKSQILKIKDYKNPVYWSGLNYNNKSYHKKRFREITEKYSADIKGKLIQLIRSKIDFLMSERLDILTNNLNHKLNHNIRHFDHSNIGSISPKKTPQNNRICLITKLDISMQRKDAIILNVNGLKYYKENAPEIYKSLKKKYLKNDKKNKGIQDQIYYIAHNIRNLIYNPSNNRKRFEKRNYHPDQLQFKFYFL